MSRYRSNRPDLNWPPRSGDEMVAWQQCAGTDLEIARLLGLSRASVYGQRVKYGIAALPRKKRARVREKRPGSQITRAAMIRLYDGRRYEDRRRPEPARRLDPARRPARRPGGRLAAGLQIAAE